MNNQLLTPLDDQAYRKLRVEEYRCRAQAARLDMRALAISHRLDSFLTGYTGTFLRCAISSRDLARNYERMAELFEREAA